jgi:hypothetical protein
MSKVYSKDKDPKKKVKTSERILEGESGSDTERNNVSERNVYNAPTPMSMLAKGGGAAAVAAITSGAYKFNVKTLKKFDQALEESFAKSTSKGNMTLTEYKNKIYSDAGIKVGKDGTPNIKMTAAKDVIKNTLGVGKTRIPFMEGAIDGTIPNKAKWEILSNPQKGIFNMGESLGKGAEAVGKGAKSSWEFIKKIPKTLKTPGSVPSPQNKTNWFDLDNPTDVPKPTNPNVPKPTVDTPEQPVVKEGTKRPYKRRVTIGQEVSLEKQGTLPSTDVTKPKRGRPPKVKPVNLLDPNVRKMMNMPKTNLGAGAGAGAAFGLSEVLTEQRENPDRGVVENIGNAAKNMIDPRNIVGIGSLPKTIMDNAGLNTAQGIAGYPYKAAELLDKGATKARDAMTTGMDFLFKDKEEAQTERDTKRLMEEIDENRRLREKKPDTPMHPQDYAREQGVIRKGKVYNSSDRKNIEKINSASGITASDIKKAGLYGDTKKSGLDALNKISDSTGIPAEVLLREGKKMWSKKKK